MRTSRDSHTVAADGAQAIAAALTPPGQIATLILPADTAWGEGSGIAPVPRGPARAAVSEDQLREASDTLRRGGRTLLLLGDRAVRAEGLGLAARIASRTGARYLAQTANARMERGAGRPAIERLPYAVDAAVEVLANCECIILVGATPPVAFFGYPGKPSELSPAHCRIVTRAAPHEDQVDALARLADAVHARRPETQETLKVDDGWLKNERKRIEDAYTFQINNFGRVILYSDRDAFDKAAERFRLVVEKYQLALSDTLANSKASFERRIVEEFSRRWEQNPPKHFTRWGIEPTPSRIRSELERLAEEVFESAISFDPPVVKILYKNVAPENIRDSGFLEILETIMRKRRVPREIIESLFETGQAAPETGSFLGRP